MHLWADKFYPAGLGETFGYFKVGDAGSQDGFYTFLQFRHFVYFFMHRLLRRFVVRVGREKPCSSCVRDCARQRKVVNLVNQAGGFFVGLDLTGACFWL